MRIGQDGLMRMQQLVIPAAAIDATLNFLRRAGTHGNEGIVLLAGEWDGTTLRVTETIAPRQRAIHTSHGCCVMVPHEELVALNEHLFERQLTIGAQVHSHPTEAYHSDTDDAFPIATMAGAVSIVLPNFAADNWQLSNCAIYRLDLSGEWAEISGEDKAKLIVTRETEA